MSSFVIAAPEVIAAASGDLTGIEEAIRDASAAAAPSTTGLAAAGADEVSAAIARVFGSYAEEFHALTAQTAVFQAEFARALGAAGVAYPLAEAANTSVLGDASLLVKGLQQQFFDQGFFSPFIYLTGQPLFGKMAVGPVVTGTTGPGLGGRLLTGLFNGSLGSGSGGVFQGTGAPGAVTGVRQGTSYLEIPVGPHGYDAPARWYFPTQADGSVNARGVIYLQHGFLGTGGWYGALATALAYGTDSIVVVPTVSSIPLPGGAFLSGTQMQQGVASLFLGNETALNLSASQAGYHGTLPQNFIMTGHSAGGGLATIAAGDYIADLGGNVANNHLQGVVMFDGVATSTTTFASRDRQPEDHEYPRLRGGRPAAIVERRRRHHESTGQPVPGAVHRGRAGQRLACRFASGQQTGRRLHLAAAHQVFTGRRHHGGLHPVDGLDQRHLQRAWPDQPARAASTAPPAATCRPAASQIFLGPATGIVLP